MIVYEVSYESVPVVLWEVIGRTDDLIKAKQMIKEDFHLSGVDKRKYRIKNTIFGFLSECEMTTDKLGEF